MAQFKKGDKVKIVSGGWGIHSCFEGMIVTIAGCEFGRYTWEEDLVGEIYTQRGGQALADPRSFVLFVPEKTTTDKIREVNQQMHQEVVAHEARLATLKAQRDVLVNTLMEELQ